MTIDDQHDLYERLDRAVEAITPRAAPVDGAMRQGRRIRLRRRSALVAGVAAVVAAGAVAVPSLRHAASQGPAAPRYTVTVQPPRPHSPAGLIASGTVNGKRWQFVAGKPGTAGADRGQQLFVASGPAFAPDGATGLIPAVAPERTYPVLFLALSSGPTQAQSTQIQYGAVRADVSSVTVRLGNGIVLTLHPVKVWGVRMVAFAVPPGGTILDATAHSRHGDIATAIPFNNPDGLASFGVWLSPGQHGLDRASGRIAAGTVGGRAWSVTANLGPWGICLDDVTAGQGSAGSCVSTTSPVGTSLMFQDEGNPQVNGGTAAAAVTRIVVHLPGGTTVQVRPVTIGQQKFFAFGLPAGKRPLTWTAYDSSGQVVASGSG